MGKSEDIAKVQILDLLLTIPSAKHAYHLLKLAEVNGLDPKDIVVAIRQVLHNHLNQQSHDISDKMKFKRWT